MRQSLRGPVRGQWPATQSAMQSAMHQAKRPRVIVAEDDPDVLQLVSVALRGLGYEITEVRSGAELLDEIGDSLLEDDVERRPDIIISDIRMPGLTGLEILAGLRHAGWSTAIVLMTAFADRETRDEARKLGVDAFFEKPFDIDDLVTAVVNVTPMPPQGLEGYGDRSSSPSPPTHVAPFNRDQ